MQNKLEASTQEVQIEDISERFRDPTDGVRLGVTTKSGLVLVHLREDGSVALYHTDNRTTQVHIRPVQDGSVVLGWIPRE